MPRPTKFCFGALFLTVVALLARHAESGDKKPVDKDKKAFSISKETTFITKPLDKDGYPDYAAALNDLLSEGVTPETNAVVLLCKAFGPKPEGAKVNPEFYKRLGIAEPPEKGDYFLGLDRYAKNVLKLDDEARRKLEDDAYENLSGRPWKPAEAPQVAAWLKAMDAPIALAIEATRRPRYYTPLLPREVDGVRDSLITCLLPTLQRCRELGHALTLRAMLHLGANETDAAWADLLAAHRLSRLVSQGGTLIENLVGVAVDAIATEGTYTFLDQAKLDAKSLDRCRKEWRDLPPSRSIAHGVDILERFTSLETVLMTARLGADYLEGLVGAKVKLKPEPLTGIQLDPALRLINGLFDRMTKALREPDRQRRKKELAKVEQEVRALKASLIAKDIGRKLLDPGATPEERGERLGHIVVVLLVPAMVKVQQASDRAEQNHRNLETAFALADYRIGTGKYPDKLEDLVPKYAKAVPLDLYSGKLPLYRPKDGGYLLYSVGLNEGDDGGTLLTDEPPGDDIGVRLPRPRRGKS